MTTHVAITPTWAQLAERYRALAESLNLYAAECRQDGYTREAESAEAAAVDYSAVAESLELGLRLVELDAVPA